MVFLIAVPRDADKKDAAWEGLRAKINEARLAEVYRFEVPSLKVGTFDQLLGLSDELGKMDTQVEGVVRKIERTLGEVADRTTQLTVKDKPAEEYLRGFAWDQFRYPLRAQLRELVDAVQKQVSTLDDELREKMGDFSAKKQQLQALSRAATGNLMVKPLDGLVKREHIVDTDYLISVFPVVLDHAKDQFLKEYETLNDWVVPRSAVEILREGEYLLYRVVVFKKMLTDFKNAAREKRYTVREYSMPVEDPAAVAAAASGQQQDPNKEKNSLKDTIDKQQKSLIRWCLVNYAEVFQAWVHLKTIRVFVESVLRYGLPANFECALLKPVKKQDRKLRQLLESMYKHLGSGSGGAEDGGASSSAAGGQGENFFPYVSIDINVESESAAE